MPAEILSQQSLPLENKKSRALWLFDNYIFCRLKKSISKLRTEQWLLCLGLSLCYPWNRTDKKLSVLPRKQWPLGVSLAPGSINFRNWPAHPLKDPSLFCLVMPTCDYLPSRDSSSFKAFPCPCVINDILISFSTSRRVSHLQLEAHELTPIMGTAAYFLPGLVLAKIHQQRFVCEGRFTLIPCATNEWPWKEFSGELVRTANSVSETTRFHYSNDKNFKHREANLKEIYQSKWGNTFLSQ